VSDSFYADVVVVGSGVAGALLAHRLAANGVDVLLLEAGKPVDRRQAVRSFWDAPIKVPECAYEQTPEAMFPRTDKPNQWYEQAGPDPFKSTYLKVLGGTTWHWLGSAIRLLPSDFKMQTLFGQAVDWPIDYATLETYYAQAEKELGVAGQTGHDLGSPRSTDYPLPAIGQSYCDQVFAKALENTPYTVDPTPQARNSIDHDLRPACCGSSSCIPVCPIQAKYDATVHIKKAVKAGARLLSQSTAVELTVNESSQIEWVRIRRWDRTEATVRAKFFVLACHAIETPRLLLASRSTGLPNGVANRSDQVGRHLMDHPIQLSWALSGTPVYPYRGPLSTSGIETLRDGSFRSHRSAFRIEIGNDGWLWPTGGPQTTAKQLVNSGLRAEALDAAIADQTSRQTRLGSLTEQLPDRNNRITLDDKSVDFYGIPRPRIHYKIDSYVLDAMAAARDVHTQIFKRINASQLQHKTVFEGAGHIMGTTRMGMDPMDSVVDANLMSHDHANLMIVGSSVFPTGGTANPTLTIAALSLRAADHLQMKLRP